MSLLETIIKPQANVTADEIHFVTVGKMNNTAKQL